MSLFGSNPSQSSGGLFGSTTSQPQQSGGLFGSTQQKPQGGLFGGLGQQPQQQQPQNQPGGLFSGLGSNQPQRQQQQGGGLFGSSSTQQQPQQQGGGLFSGLGSNTQQNQQQKGGLFSGFGTTTQQQPQQQSGGLFSGLGASTQQQQQQPQQQSGGLFSGFGHSAQQQQPQQQSGGGLFSGLGSTQQQQQPAPQQSLLGLGQSTNQPQLGRSALWTPQQGLPGIHRPVPEQMTIVRDKWDPTSRTSQFRSYLYNQVGEDSAPFYTPTPRDDEAKWEDALRKRPDPSYVPVLVQGFLELGQRAQLQRNFLSMMQSRLHEINTALTALLSKHDLSFTVRIAASRRKHLVLSQRCLSLAAKTQVIRNRGYAMDEAEEELQRKLSQLERSIFDPSLNGRAEEIWARMLAIRERSKRLQLEMEKTGQDSAQQQEDGLDDAALKTAKKILDDYASQLQHLSKELASLTKEFDALQLPSAQ